VDGAGCTGARWTPADPWAAHEGCRRGAAGIQGGERVAEELAESGAIFGPPTENLEFRAFHIDFDYIRQR
jgi:hypothetical protein